MSVSLRRVLAKYSDITLFSRETIGDIIPNLIVFTGDDPYKSLFKIRKAEQQYPTANLAYLTDLKHPIYLCVPFIHNVVNVFSTDSSTEAIYKFLTTVASIPKAHFRQQFRTLFLNRLYNNNVVNGLTCRELCILGAYLRGYKLERITRILKLSMFGIRYRLDSACARLKLKRKLLKNNTVLLWEYGGIKESTKPYRQYRIPKQIHTAPGYFVIPKFRD